MTKYVCPHCYREGESPKAGHALFACGYCNNVSSRAKAFDAGEARDLAERIKTAACPRCASKPCACDIQKAGLCEDEGCTNAGTPHVCITKTDCRSEEGITVGLIDTIINSARLLKQRSWNSTAILEALKDLRTDEDLGALTGVFEGAEAIHRLDAQNKELRAELQGAKKLLETVLNSGLLKRGASMTERVRDFLATGYKETPKPVEIERDAIAAHLLHALSVLRDHHLYGDLPSVSADVRDCLMLIGEPFPLSGGAPKPVGPTTYSEFVDIESRNDVQEALENFSHDSTRDNAVELIKIIYEATKPKC